MSLDLVNFADIKAWMNLAGASATEYPKLRPIMDNVSAEIESHLSRELELTTRSDSFSAPPVPVQMFPLKGLPVTASTVTVTVDGTAITSDEYSVKPYGVYTLSPVVDVPVVISYTGGAATTATSLHKEIKAAALLQTVHEFKRVDNPGALNVSNEGGSVSYPQVVLLDSVLKMLSKHRHPLTVAGF